MGTKIELKWGNGMIVAKDTLKITRDVMVENIEVYDSLHFSEGTVLNIVAISEHGRMHVRRGDFSFPMYIKNMKPYVKNGSIVVLMKD